MDIDQRIIKIMQKLEGAGYQALIVGGAIRNLLLNKEVVDYDLATSASFQAIKDLFDNTKDIYRQNVKWSTKVLYKGISCEITPFRQERNYHKRLPQNIKYVSTYKEDVQRRDFTINAIAYNLKQEIIDPLNGLSDLNKQILRVIGQKEKRFIEDPIRILRGMRLAATLNFTIEAKTLHFMQKHYKKALEIKNNQSAKEIRDIIFSENFAYVDSLFPHFIKDISEDKFIFDKNFDYSKLENKSLQYGYLNFVLNIEESNKIYQYLNISNSLKEKHRTLKDIFDFFKKDYNKKDVKKLFVLNSKQDVNYVFKLLLKIGYLNKEQVKTFKSFDYSEIIKVSELLINVDDIIGELSIKKKWLILEKLKISVNLDKIENNKEVLLKEVKKHLKDMR